MKRRKGQDRRQAFVQFRVVGYTELDPIWHKRGLTSPFTSPFTILRTWTNNIARAEWSKRLIHRQLDD
jgi:hypothetical protein